MIMFRIMTLVLAALLFAAPAWAGPEYDKDSTSEYMEIFIPHVTTGAGLTGLAYNSSGLEWWYYCDGTTATEVTPVTATVGTYTSSGFIEIDATNVAGFYQIGHPNAALATACGENMVVMLYGATNMSVVRFSINLKDAAAGGGGDFVTLGSLTADSGTTTTITDAALTYADTDYLVGSWVRITNGTLILQTRLITGFNPATDTITVSPAFTQAVSTHTYEILPGADINRVILAEAATDVTNQVTADVTTFNGDTVPVLNIASQYDTTGLTGDTFPSTQSQLSGIANVGSAIHRPASSYTLTTGTESANSYTDTAALNGTRHTHTDAAGVMELYYEFSVGAGIASSAQLTGYLTGQNDDLDVYAYDWIAAAWVQVGNIQGANSTNNSVYSFDLFVDMTGTAANKGTVRLRLYKASGLTTATLAVDQVFIAFSQAADSYTNAQIWYDDSASNTGTTVGVDGTAGNPVSTEAAVNTLFTSTGLHSVHVVAGSAYTLADTHTSRKIFARGGTVALGGQAVNSSHFFGGSISGTGTAATTMVFHDADIGTASVQKAHFHGSTFDGTVTMTLTGDYHFINSQSGVPGAGAPTFTKTAGQTITAEFRRWSGGIIISGLESGDVITVGGEMGTITLNGADATVEVRGTYKSLVNNLTGSPTVNIDGAILAADVADILVDTGTTIPGTITTVQNDLDITTGTNGVLIDDDAITAAKIAAAAITSSEAPNLDQAVSGNATPAEVATELATYDGPTDAEMIARTLPQADYFLFGSDTVVNVATTANVTNDVDINMAQLYPVTPSAGTTGQALEDADDFLNATVSSRQPSGAVDLNADQSGVTIGTVNALGTTAKNDVNAEVDTALADYDGPTDTEMVAAFTEIKGATWASGTDTLEAIRDRGDAAWVTGAGGSVPDLLQNTTIATLASQTNFTLTAGSADDGAYDGALVVVTDASTPEQKAVGTVSTYTGSTKTVVLVVDPAIFTMAVGDTIDIIASPTTTVAGTVDANLIQIGGVTQSATDLKDFADAGYDPATDKVQGVVLVDTLTAYTGNTPQTADHTAGIADIPTVAEFNARTRLTADYFDQTTDPVELVIAIASETAGGASAERVVDMGADEVYTGVTHNVSQSHAKRIRDLQEAGTYTGGVVFVDTVNGTAGTTVFDNGTEVKPSLTFADALVIAADSAVNSKQFHMTPDSSITLAATLANRVMEGHGWTLALGGQNIAGSHFIDALISGASTGSGIEIHDSEVTNVTTDTGEIHNSSINGTFTLNEVGQYHIHNSHAGDGGADPIFDFRAALGNTTFLMHGWQGGMEFQNFGASGIDVADVAGNGKITLNANSTGGTLNIQGAWEIVDNSGGAVTIVKDDNTTNIEFILDDTGSSGVIVATNNDKTGYSLTAGERTSIATEIMGTAVDGSRTVKCVMAAAGAVLDGLSTVSGGGTVVTYYAPDDVTARVAVTFDALGNRTVSTVTCP